MKLSIQGFLRSPSIPNLPRSESVAEQRFRMIDKQGKGIISKTDLKDHLQDLCKEFSQTNDFKLRQHRAARLDASGALDFDATVDKLFEQYDRNGVRFPHNLFDTSSLRSFLLFTRSSPCLSIAASIVVPITHAFSCASLFFVQRCNSLQDGVIDCNEFQSLSEEVLAVLFVGEQSYAM